MSPPYLRPGLPAPAPSALDQAYWDGLSRDRLLLQRCRGCHRHQWGPEWICHRCHNVDLDFVDVKPEGVIYSYQRVWHPVHPALQAQGPYLIVLVEIPAADGVRLVGNLLGDPTLPVIIGSEVVGEFEHHPDHEPPFTLLQWRRVAGD